MFHGDSGNILYDGTDITQISPESRKIGLVYQSHALFPHMKVWENIAYGLKMRGGIQRRTDCKLLTTWWNCFPSPMIKNQYPGVLSGGESQRTALARALAVKPDPPSVRWTIFSPGSGNQTKASDLMTGSYSDEIEAFLGKDKMNMNNNECSMQTAFYDDLKTTFSGTFNRAWPASGKGISAH